MHLHQGWTLQHHSLLQTQRQPHNATLLQLPPKHIKTAIPYGQALRVHRICSDEEECDGHLEIRRDALIRTGSDAQLIDRQFRRATVRNRNDLLRRQTRAATDKVPFVVQHFTGAEKLRYVFRDLQRIMNEDKHLAKTFPTPPQLAFKQPPNLKQIIVRSKLPSFQHNSTQPCHGRHCKTCQSVGMDATITRGDTSHH
ncbi:hypothetical protein chiPu_0026652, partial [Chiloscyllium punctatum]|nr:hypothetical protein [Chiloscyllium punctatum]